MRIYEEKTFATIAKELKIPLGTALGRMRVGTDQVASEAWIDPTQPMATQKNNEAMNERRNSKRARLAGVLLRRRRAERGRGRAV